MGFLRKVGRKIKKGVKKLFSSKIGAFLGSMALGYILSPAINSVFGGIKGALGFGQKPVGDAVAKEIVAKGAAESVATETLAKQAVGVPEIGADFAIGDISKVASERGLGKQLTTDVLTSAPVDAKTLNDSIASTIGSNPATRAADLTNKIAQGTLQGDIPLKVNISVTDALNDVDTYLKTGNMFTPEQTKLIQQTSASAAELTDPKGFKKLVKGFKEFKEAPIEKTMEYIGEDFVPDVAKSVVGTVATQYALGEPEEPFVSGGVMPQPQQEAAQGAYIQDIAPQFMASSNMTRVPSFQELSQQTLYGNGAPQYMSQIYQPLFGV